MPALRPVLPQQTLPPLALPQLTHPWDSTSWLPRPSEPRRREVKVQSAVAFKDIYRGPLIFIFLLKISGNLSCVLYIFLCLYMCVRVRVRAFIHIFLYRSGVWNERELNTPTFPPHEKKEGKKKRNMYESIYVCMYVCMYMYVCVYIHHTTYSLLYSSRLGVHNIH